MRVRVPDASARLSRAGDGIGPGAADARTCTRCRACRRRSTGPRRWWRSARARDSSAAIEETLGVVLKAKEDIDAHARRPHHAAARSRDRARRAGRMSAGAGDALLAAARLRAVAAPARPRRAHRAHARRRSRRSRTWISAGATTSSTCCARCSCTVTTISTPSTAPSTPSGPRRSPEPSDGPTPDRDQAPGARPGGARS